MRSLVLVVTIVAFGVAFVLLGLGRRRKSKRPRRANPAAANGSDATRTKPRSGSASGARERSRERTAAKPARSLSRAAPTARVLDPHAATHPNVPAVGEEAADDPTMVSGPPELPDDEDNAPGEGSGDVTVVTRRFTIEAMGGAEGEIEGDEDLPWVPAARSEVTNPTMPFALILVTAVGQTDVGKRREGNEDNYLVLPEHWLFVVADGLGGHAAGEVASALAVENIGQAFRSQKFEGTARPERSRRGDELARSIEMANRAVYQQSRRVKGQAGMGTTVVAARFAPNKKRVYIAHVGDSRCYRLRGKVLEQLTQDHTLEAHGVTGARAGVLTRAVGQESAVQVDLLTDTPEVDDQYLLCSDGLTKMVPDAVIRDVLLRESNIERCVQALIEEANRRGGRDNITVILVRVMGSLGVPGAIIPVGG